MKLEPASRAPAIFSHEAWQPVRLFKVLFEEIELVIEVRRACVADIGIAVTACATVDVHPGPQALRLDFVMLLKFCNSGVERFYLRPC